jgi:hypothetical protein
MVDINAVAAELHRDAVERGFWAVDDALMKHFAKMHSELSEALQADRCGCPMLYVDDITMATGPETDIEKFDGRKPEGIAAELADFVMMMLDVIAQLGVDVNKMLAEHHYTYYSDYYVHFSTLQLHQIVMGGHKALNTIVYENDNLDKLGSALLYCVFGVELWLKQRGVDLWAVIALKVAYNKNRPKLHGRKY